jgi:hypothetical protein
VAKAKLTFDVHPGVAMIQRWTTALPEKTGHSLDEWADLVKAENLPGRKARIVWLKERGVGGNMASMIADYAFDKLTWDGEPSLYLKQAAVYVEAMFQKGKQWQRPIFEAIAAEVRKLGKDVKICPCKTMVPFYRNREFAHLKPVTQKRLGLGLALPGVPFKGRLQRNPRANDKDRHHHLVELRGGAKEVNAELVKWLRMAYEADAE